MKLLITGANGYIGTVLANHALAAGHQVAAATRTSNSCRYDLQHYKDFVFPDDIGAVIHLAANTVHPSAEEILAAEFLQEQATAQNARFIFISSQAATENARTPYGRVKWQTEQQVLAAGGSVVKPGMVYGGQARGLFGKLVRFCKWPLLPVPYPSARVQPVHVDEVCAAILAQLSAPAGLKTIAGAPATFQAFLKDIAHYRLGKSLWTIPVPVRPAITVLRVIGKANRLESLTTLQPLPVDTNLRPLPEGMAGNARKLLAREACTLFRCLLHIRPKRDVIKHYIRACGDASPLPYPYGGMWYAMLHDVPLLGVITRRLPYAETMQERRIAALVIAENSSGHAFSFVQATPRSIHKMALEMVWTGVGETVRMMVALPVALVFIFKRSVKP